MPTNFLEIPSSSDDLTTQSGGDEYSLVLTTDGVNLTVGSDLPVLVTELWTFTNNFPITPSLAPTTDYQVANKKYVDDELTAYTTDRLTSTNSTLVLSDDASSQYLTGNLGSLFIRPSSGYAYVDHATESAMIVVENATSNGIFFTASATGGGLYFSGPNDFTFGKIFGANVFTVDTNTYDLDFEQNVTFSAGTLTFAGIQNQNLLDKTASESVSGTWDFDNEVTFDGGIHLSTSGRFDSIVADAVSAKTFYFKPSTTLTPGTDRSILRVEDSSSTNYFEVLSDGNLYCTKGIFTGAVTKSVIESTRGSHLGYTWTGTLPAGAAKMGTGIQVNFQPGNTGFSVTGLSCLSTWDNSGAAASMGALTGGTFASYHAHAGGTASQINGGLFTANINSTATSSTITRLIGGQFYTVISSASSTVSACYTLWLRPNVGTVSSAPTNMYGIYFEDYANQGSSNTDVIRVVAQTNGGSTGTRGNIRFIGGAFDSGHLQLDTTHLWQDQTNNIFRFKNSAPTADTQGVGFSDAGETGAQVPTLSSNLPAAAAGTASVTWLPVWIGATKGWVPVWQ